MALLETFFFFCNGDLCRSSGRDAIINIGLIFDR